MKTSPAASVHGKGLFSWGGSGPVYKAPAPRVHVEAPLGWLHAWCSTCQSLVVAVAK